MARNTLCARQTKVSQFQFPYAADQQILRFHVPVEDAPLVTVRQAAQQLEQEQSHISVVQPARVSFHVLGQVRVLYVAGKNLLGYSGNLIVLPNLYALLTTYSKTNVSVSLVWTMSCRVTMLACFNSLSRDASRIAVNGAPSSSCSLISFNATT